MALIGDLLAKRRAVSLEFFPPKSQAGIAQLRGSVSALSSVSPDFISVTCGAGGRDLLWTRDVVIEFEASYDFGVMAHLTSIGHTCAEVDELLDAYERGEVSHILALRGDPRGDRTTREGAVIKISRIRV